jgi:Cys-rich repeat protein
MNIKQLALVLGATAVFAGGGVGAVACSSSSNGGSSSGGSSGGGSGSSSGSGSGSSSGGTMDSSMNEDTGSGSGGDSGAGADCGSIPQLRPNPAGDVYCGFGADGGHIECLADAGQGYCCLGGSLGGGQYAPQICAAMAAGCVNGAPDAGGSAAIPIECNQISDCPTNGSPGASACCLQGASAPAEVAGCGYLKSKGGTAIVCEGTGGGADAAATACAAGEVQICSANSDCPTGTTCQPGKWKIYQIGFCQ